MADALRPLDPSLFDYWCAEHLLNRAGFGGTPSQVRALANMGLSKAVDSVVDFQTIEAAPVQTDLFDKDIMQPRSRNERLAIQRARKTGDEAALAEARRRRQERQQADRAQIGELRHWWLKRMIETSRPLEEKMTLFWHGHFATGYRAIEDSYHMFMQNQLFRRHAVGNFSLLVHGIIRDPAMLRYLNNDQNRKEKPNENLARELMELFTLGEGNEYTENDIKQGARALTGYTFGDDSFIDLSSRRYHRLHDNGLKHILGSIGHFDGDDFVRVILSRPSCSKFICLKLYRFFVNDLPGEPDASVRAVIIDLARLFRKSKYQLKPVLRTLFSSEHFFEPANTASLIKSPIQLIVQAIRSLQTPTRNIGVLLRSTDRMGQSLFLPPSVKGWEGGRSWINTSTLFVRQNLLFYLLTGRRPDHRGWQTHGEPFDAVHLIDHLRAPDGGVDTREAVTYLLWFNFGREPDAARVDTLVKAVRNRGDRLDNDALIHLLALITASPEYQLC